MSEIGSGEIGAHGTDQLSRRAALANVALMSADEAAEYLLLEPSTLAKMRHRGEGPQFIRRSARAILYRRSDCDDWLAARVHSSTSSY